MNTEDQLRAGPSKPVSVLGMNGASSAGDSFYVMNDEKEIKQIASKRQQLQREQGLQQPNTSLWMRLEEELHLEIFKN